MVVDTNKKGGGIPPQDKSRGLLPQFSMNNARQTILRLVAEGKITVEEADELLDAIGKAHSSFGDFFTPREAGERAREAGRRAKEAGARAKEQAAKAKEAAKGRVRTARARARRQDRDKQYDYEGASDFNWPWDQPDWQWPWDQPDWQWPWEKAGGAGGRSEFDAPEGAQLKITSNGGDLVIRGTDETASIGITGLSAASQVTTNDKEISISSSGANLVIEAPKQVASVEIAQNGGDMSISKLAAALIARGAGGDMSISESTGTIQASVEGGDLSLAGIKSTEVEAQANAGDISLNMLSPVNEGSISLSSGSGDISVVLPPDSQCEVSANTGDGGISHSLPPESTEIVEETDSHLSVKLNGGGANLTLSTKTGDIAIKA